MAFDLKAAGGYGSGALGDVTDPNADDLINSYAVIKSIDGNTITISDSLTNIIYGAYHDLTSPDIVGAEVLIHAFACTNGAASPPQLGLWRVCKITQTSATTTSAEFSGNTITLTLSKSLADLNFDRYFWQIITIPHFANLTLTNSSIRPAKGSAYDGGLIPGGVVAFKCSDTFTMNGGHVNLKDYGLTDASTTTYRPNTTQENNGTLDTALYSGCENSITKDRLLLNVGDGAAFIIAKNISTQSTSRIGNPSIPGVQYCRGSSDSKASHSGSNIGGSTILIAADTWTGFSPANIAKYRSGSGRGLARAYIALNNLNSAVLPDEGLYALDNISVKGRLSAQCNIKDFGNGSDSVSLSNNDSIPMNSYAKVTAVSADYKTFTLSSFVDGKITFAVGRLVMIHQLQKSSGQDVNSGRFSLAKITEISGSNYTVDAPFECNPSSYYVQMLTVPQVNSATISGEYNATAAWNNGVGGIFALACKGTLNLSSAKINLEGKGTFKSIVNKLVGNAFMKHRLFIGQGNGSAFILADTINMSSSTRIGGRYDGATFGGKAVYRKTSISATPQFGSEGGYAGTDGTSLNDNYPERLGTAGWGGGAGTNASESNNGGWFSNAKYTDADANADGDAGKRVLPGGGWQGAHVLIIADTINSFSLSAISTGGAGGKCYSSYNHVDEVRGKDGGAGYGGGGFPRNTGCTQPNYAFGGSGGYRGGGGSSHAPTSGVTYTGGGGAGAAFVYCNNFTNQSTTGIITG